MHFFEVSQAKREDHEWEQSMTGSLSDATVNGVAKSEESGSPNRAEQILREIVKATGANKGRAFFTDLVRSVSEQFGVTHVFLTETRIPDRLHVLASWINGKPGTEFEYTRAHTPCEEVLKKGACSWTDDVAKVFPEDDYLHEIGARSYAGAPLTDAEGRVLGHICVLHNQPLKEETLLCSVLTLFASRATAELHGMNLEEERRRRDHALKDQNRALRKLGALDAHFITDLESVFGEITRVSAETLDVQRVGIWQYRERASKLRCVLRYDTSNHKYSSSMEIHQDLAPGMFQLLAQKRVLQAPEADRSPYTELADVAPNMRSALIVPVRVKGELMGHLMFEETQHWRTWALEEVNFALTIGEMTGSALARHKHQVQLAESARAEERRKMMVDSAYTAGMAEIATGVIHNIGNVVNSLCVAYEQLRLLHLNYELNSMRKVNNLFQTHKDDLGKFFSENPKAPKIPAYFETLTRAMEEKADVMDEEFQNMATSLEMIRNTIQAQQTYAKSAGILEEVRLHHFVDEVLNLHLASVNKRFIRIIRKLPPVRPTRLQRTKATHVLLNLIKNAVEILQQKPDDNRTLTFETGEDKNGCPWLAVSDNGPGVSHENQYKIFQFGFTTKSDGRGFGLHASANAMTEMGGALELSSQPGEGASFIMRFEVRDPRDWQTD